MVIQRRACTMPTCRRSGSNTRTSRWSTTRGNWCSVLARERVSIEERIGMKSLLAVVVATLACGGVAHAQTATPGAEDKVYIEVVAQSAFSNVTSQSYGVEGGFTIRPQMQ